MTALDVLGRADELTDGTGSSMGAVMGAAIGPYRKCRSNYFGTSKRRVSMSRLLVLLRAVLRNVLLGLIGRKQYERIRQRVRDGQEEKAIKRAHQRVKHATTDPRISYPSYKSLDAFIDVERLKALDSYVVDRLQKRSKDSKFYTGDLTLHTDDERLPGGNEIHLMRNTSPAPYNYQELNKTELWQPSEEAAEFSELMDFIYTLPFKSIGRAIILYDINGTAVTPHRDHAQLEICHEFIWFRTQLSKPLYLLNERTQEKQYVESYSAWFDTVNQFHGGDAAPGLSLSIRVDGVFTDEFRARIPVPAYNIASTASLWAFIGDAAPKAETAVSAAGASLSQPSARRSLPS
jgi:hypothetical protein